MKETLKDRGHDEKSQMSKESVAELKTFDDSYEKMDFQHLPARKTLEFHFVKDLFTHNHLKNGQAGDE